MFIVDVPSTPLSRGDDAVELVERFAQFDGAEQKLSLDGSASRVYVTPGDTAVAVVIVHGSEITFAGNDTCNGAGGYRWSVHDRELQFTAIGVNPCPRPGLFPAGVRREGRDDVSSPRTTFRVVRRAAAAAAIGPRVAAASSSERRAQLFRGLDMGWVGDRAPTRPTPLMRGDRYPGTGHGDQRQPRMDIDESPVHRRVDG